MPDDYESVPLKRVGSATVRPNYEDYDHYGYPNATGLKRLANVADWTFAVRHPAAQLIADRARCHFGGNVEFYASAGTVYYRPCTGDWPRRVNDYVSAARDFYSETKTTGEPK